MTAIFSLPFLRKHICGSITVLLRIGKGMSVDEAIGDITQSVEGIRAIKAGYEIGKKYNLDIPIIETANLLVDGKLDAREALSLLMSRSLKPEKYW